MTGTWARALVFLAAMAFAAAAAHAGAERAPDGLGDRATEMLLAWHELQVEMLRETAGFSPPVAARALAYVGVAAWEAAAPALPERRSLAGQLRAFEGVADPDGAIDGALAVNGAIAAAMRGLYPNALAVHLDAVDRLEKAHAEHLAEGVDAELAERSVRFGAGAADAVLAWARDDGGHEGHERGFSGVPAPEGPSSWVPTPRPSGPPFPPLHPDWGENRPLVLADDACAAPPPPTYSEEPGSAFHDEAREVYDTVRGLTPEQRDIALFWADDPGITATPAGHWLAIVNEVVRSTEPPFEVALEAYARLGIAANDAFIACWKTKYRYDLIRPLTYIQRVIDAEWNAEGVTDPVTTPPFPEYTSGHSVLSSAIATTLTDLFGTVGFTDRTHVDTRGFAPRTFASLREAAEEAAVSRLYGGIHFRAAIERGLEQGRCVGQRVDALRFRD